MKKNNIATFNAKDNIKLVKIKSPVYTKKSLIGEYLKTINEITSNKIVMYADKEPFTEIHSQLSEVDKTKINIYSKVALDILNLKDVK